MNRTSAAPGGVALLAIPLVGCTLLICTAVASLPALLASAQPPRPAPQPSDLTPALALPTPGAAELVVVRSASGHWYLNQQPIAAPALARLLAEESGQKPVRLLASDRLSIAELVQAQAWLRPQGPRPVVLEPALIP